MINRSALYLMASYSGSSIWNQGCKHLITCFSKILHETKYYV